MSTTAKKQNVVRKVLPYTQIASLRLLSLEKLVSVLYPKYTILLVWFVHWGGVLLFEL